MLAVRGSGWSGNFPSQECNDVTEIVLSSLSSLALPLLFSPFCSSFFGTQNPFFSPPLFSSHPFASAVLFLTLLSSLYYFWMARSCEESPLSKVESHWCWIAERKGGRLEEGGDRGKPERDMPRVSPCIILREKAKATAGCVTFAALPMGAQKRPFHRRNTRNNTVETAVN